MNGEKNRRSRPVLMEYRVRRKRDAKDKTSIKICIALKYQIGEFHMDRMNLTACRDGSAAMRWSDVVMWSNDSKEQAKIQPNDPGNNSSNTHTHNRTIDLFHCSLLSFSAYLLSSYCRGKDSSLLFHKLQNNVVGEERRGEVCEDAAWVFCKDFIRLSSSRTQKYHLTTQESR